MYAPNPDFDGDGITNSDEDTNGNLDLNDDDPNNDWWTNDAQPDVWQRIRHTLDD